MSRLLVCLGLFLLGASWSTATAGTTGIGTNLGLTYYSPDDGGDGVTAITWPSGGTLLGLAQPGLRLSFLDESGLNEFYVDTGLSYLTSNGESITMFVGTLDYQRNFAPVDGTGAYVTAGIGISIVDFGGGADSTNPRAGGGIGIRHGLAHGKGALRAEARFDRVFEDDDGINALSEFGLRLGFDLWLK